jgi:alpha-1,2-mannosyltransferase
VVESSRTPAVVALVLVLGLGANAIYRARPPGHERKARTDLTVYLAGARALLDGDDPLGARNERGWPYVYPATLAVGLTPLTLLPLRVAAGVWFALSVLAFAWGVLGVRRALGREGPFEWLSDGLPLILVLLPTASALLRGQVGPLLLGLLGAALACLARRRELSAGLLVALAASIKLTPALVLVGLAAARRWRAFLAGLLGLVVWLLLLPAPFLGLEGAARSLTHFGERMIVRPLSDPGDPNLTTENIHIPNNQSISSQLIRRTDGAARLVSLLLLAAGVCGTALLLSSRGRDPPRPGAYALLLGAPLLAAPIAWHHHHILLLPALAVLTAKRDRATVRLALGAFALLSLLHFAVTPLRPLGLLGLGTLLIFAVLAGHEWTAHAKPHPRSHGSPDGVSSRPASQEK